MQQLKFQLVATLRDYFLLTAADLALYPEGSPEHIRAEHSAANTSRTVFELFGASAAEADGQSFLNSASVERESHGNTVNETGGRNKRSVWNIATGQFKAAHYATFLERLVEPCILAGCPEGGTVLDPFTGSGTTGAVAKRLRRNFVGVEINPEYWQMAVDRIAAASPEFQQLEIEERKA